MLTDSGSVIKIY